MVITSWLVSVRAERRGEYSASRVHGDMIAKESFQAVPLFYFGQLGQEGGQKAVDGFVLFFLPPNRQPAYEFSGTWWFSG